MGEKRGMKALEAWCRRVVTGYRDVRLDNMTTAWRDGLAFCAVIHHFRPDLIDFDSLSKENIFHNNNLAFSVAEQCLGIPALLDPEDMVKYTVPDKLSIMTYTAQYYQYFHSMEAGLKKTPTKRPLDEKNDSIASLTETPGKRSAIAITSSTTASAPPPGTIIRRNDVCQACKNRVYILERLIVDNKLYHRTCFKCSKCQVVLNPGSYTEGQEPDRYECIQCPTESDRQSTATARRLGKALLRPFSEYDSRGPPTDKGGAAVGTVNDKVPRASSPPSVKPLGIASAATRSRMEFCANDGVDDVPDDISAAPPVTDTGQVAPPSEQPSIDNGAVPAKVEISIASRQSPSPQQRNGGPPRIIEQLAPQQQQQGPDEVTAAPPITSCDVRNNNVADFKTRPPLPVFDTHPSRQLTEVQVDPLPSVTESTDRRLSVSDNNRREPSNRDEQSNIDTPESDATRDDDGNDVVETPLPPPTSSSSFLSKPLPPQRPSSLKLTGNLNRENAPAVYLAVVPVPSARKRSTHKEPQDHSSGDQDVTEPPHQQTSDAVRPHDAPSTGAELITTSSSADHADVFNESAGQEPAGPNHTSTVHSVIEKIDIGVTGEVTLPVEQLADSKDVSEDPVTLRQPPANAAVEKVVPVAAPRARKSKLPDKTEPPPKVVEPPLVHVEADISENVDEPPPKPPRHSPLPSTKSARYRPSTSESSPRPSTSVAVAPSQKKEYPIDLNPFGDDDEVVGTDPQQPEVVKQTPVPSSRSVSKPTTTSNNVKSPSLNPFGDSDDEDEPETPQQVIATPTSATGTRRVIPCDIKSLNPFSSDSDSEEEESSPHPASRTGVTPPRPTPRSSLDARSAWAASAAAEETRSLDGGDTLRKKRPAPKPPGSVSPSPSPRSVRKSSAPPPPPSSATSSPYHYQHQQRHTINPASFRRQLLPHLPTTDSAGVTAEGESLQLTEKSLKELDNMNLTRGGGGGSSSGAPHASPDRLPPRPAPPPPSYHSRSQADLSVSSDLPLSPDSLESRTSMQSLQSSPSAGSGRGTTFGQWKKKKLAPPVPVPLRRQIEKLPIKEIHVELEEIEEKQLELEKVGVEIEKAIREKFSDDVEPSAEEEDLILQLFELVNKKNALFRRQAELTYLKRQHRLEEEHADLEFRIRIMMEKPISKKTEADISVEEQLIARLVEVVTQRNEIIESMEMDRLREAQEDQSIQEQLAIHRGQRRGSISSQSSSTSGTPAKLEKIKSKKKEKKEKKKKLKAKDEDKDTDEAEATATKGNGKTKEKKRHWF